MIVKVALFSTGVSHFLTFFLYRAYTISGIPTFCYVVAPGCCNWDRAVTLTGELVEIGLWELLSIRVLPSKLGWFTVLSLIFVILSPVTVLFVVFPDLRGSVCWAFLMTFAVVGVPTSFTLTLICLLDAFFFRHASTCVLTHLEILRLSGYAIPTLTHAILFVPFL